MKLREILFFELSYQLRRGSTWFYFVAVMVVAFLMVRGNNIYDARNGDYLLNSPYAIAQVTVFSCLVWLLAAASVAGNAATRDIQARMHPLIYSTPLSKRDYLGGRFLAAFAVNALILLAVPVGLVLALAWPGVEAEILGPSRPTVYLRAYLFIALPNAFVATAIQFALAIRYQRAMVSYFGSLLLFVSARFASVAVGVLWWRELGMLLDPIGPFAIVSVRSETWTPIQRNTFPISLEGSLLWNRLFWIGVALCALILSRLWFHFRHPAKRDWWPRITRRRDPHSTRPQDTANTDSLPISSTPRATTTFGLPTRLRQLSAISWKSFREIVNRPGGAILLGSLAMLMVLAVPQAREFMDVPLLPRTEHILAFLAAPLANPRSGLWMIIPLLTLFFAGELAWRERESGINEITDAAPVPEWVFLVGKLLGLGLVLSFWLALLMTAGIVLQTVMGYHHYEIGLYLQVLFGLQLSDYLLFAVLALVIHVLVNQKHIAHLAALLVYGFIAYASTVGIEHNLLVYASDSGWSYTDMQGFGGSLGPWLWFKLYWVAWALLLALGARLLWVRGPDRDLGDRLRLARTRLTKATIRTAVLSAGLILTSGGFIFYNTNLLNRYATAASQVERRAEYERRYARYKGLPQPRLARTDLRIEIYPKRRAAEVRGSYQLENHNAVPIDSLHLSTLPNRFFTGGSELETVSLGIDRPARRVLSDEALGYQIYTLEDPLRPGDSLRLSFEVHFSARGFANDGLDPSVAANGTYFTNQGWLPAIGYQPVLELGDAGDRRTHGLPQRPALPPLDDAEAVKIRAGAEEISFEAVVGTDEGQTAIAPGILRRSWKDGVRRYFHYSTDAPIGNEYAIFSADYAIHEGRWNDVAIQVFHHPDHTANLERMLGSVQASLDYFAEQFGPYPYRFFRIVEHPGHGMGMHAEAATIDHQEGFTLMNPEEPARGLDLPFHVVSHEVAHQWWGSARLVPARVEGAGLLIESLATYSAMQVVEKTYGDEHLRRLLKTLRYSYQIPRTRASAPLLRANNAFLNYRKGPFALHALSRYIGKERVNRALRTLLEKHGSGIPPWATSLDLYRELQAVTPDSFQSLLHDLFEVNTYWELETRSAIAEQTEEGAWNVVVEVGARKVVVDEEGTETPIPLDDWLEIGIFGDDKGDGLSAPLYLEKHRIQSPRQTFTLTVPGKPVRAGIDPYLLLIDWDTLDNVVRARER